jgi:hypothetical protein
MLTWPATMSWRAAAIGSIVRFPIHKRPLRTDARIAVVGLLLLVVLKPLEWRPWVVLGHPDQLP